MIASSKQTRTNMFAVVWKHCGIVNISSHYEVAMVLSIYAPGLSILTLRGLHSLIMFYIKLELLKFLEILSWPADNDNYSVSN